MKTYLRYFRHIWLSPNVLIFAIIFILAPIDTSLREGTIWRLFLIPVFIFTLPFLAWMQAKLDEEMYQECENQHENS